jgi:hypothetical protein
MSKESKSCQRVPEMNTDKSSKLKSGHIFSCSLFDRIKRFEGLIGTILGALISFYAQNKFYEHDSKKKELERIFSHSLNYLEQSKHCSSKLLFDSEKLFDLRIEEDIRIREYVDFLKNCSGSLTKLKLSLISSDLISARTQDQFTDCLIRSFDNNLETFNSIDLNKISNIGFMKEHVVPVLGCRKDVFKQIETEIEFKIKDLGRNK